VIPIVVSRPGICGAAGGWRCRSVAVLVLVLILLVTAACDGSTKKSLPSPTSANASASATPSVSASITSSSTSSAVDARAQPAVDAYENFWATSMAANASPFAPASTPAASEDFTKFSFDPARANQLTYVAQLVQSGVAWKGSHPTPRLSVTAIDLEASPYPTVTLTNCPTPAPTWQAYYLATGKPVPGNPSAVPLPYEITVQMIKYQGQWGVQSLTSDSSKTCTG
jgi:hypothetical protein